MMDSILRFGEGMENPGGLGWTGSLINRERRAYDLLGSGGYFDGSNWRPVQLVLCKPTPRKNAVW